MSPWRFRVEVNGLEQGMFIEPGPAGSPVLLLLHGGLPLRFLARRYPTGFDQLFTVVWWERRGSGISYDPRIPPATMTLEQMVRDTLALTDLLREWFGQEAIYLMAHSGGTPIGIQAAARAPGAYHAYVAVAQITDQLESERLAYDFMLRRFRELGDERMVRRLERAPVTGTLPFPRGYLAVRDIAMHRLGGGTTRDIRSVMTGIFVRSLLSREYSLRERARLWRGKRFSDRHLWDEILSTDLTALVPELAIPAYFVHGRHDVTVSYPLTRAYFEQLRAPVKGFYTFERSAHSPLFEEPERMCRILREDVLHGTTVLADPGASLREQRLDLARDDELLARGNDGHLETA